ncbi:MAG TPA: hypothetical protein PK961_17565 [bacterium]|nr:hypothetical protein [bacterium]
MSSGFKKLATVFSSLLVVVGAWFYLDMPSPKIAGLERPQLTLSVGEEAAAPGARPAAVRPGGATNVRKPARATSPASRKSIRDRRANRARTRIDRLNKNEEAAAGADSGEEVGAPRPRRPAVRPQGMKRRTAPLNAASGALGQEAGEMEGLEELPPEDEMPLEEGEGEVPPEQYEQDGGMEEIM